MRLTSLLKKSLQKIIFCSIPFCLAAEQVQIYEGYNDMYTCCDCSEDVCSSWNVYADFLWWRASEGGLALGKQIAVSREGLNPATGNFALVTKDSQVRNLHFDFDPGFRLGIAYERSPMGWNSRLEWTHFHTHASTRGCSFFEPSVPGDASYWAFMPYWEVIPQNFPAFAHGKWHLNMDLIDLDIGHSYTVCDCVAFRPYVGLRGALIDQDFRVCSQNNLNLDGGFDFDGTSYMYASRMKAHCDFWGVGPRLGFDIELKARWGISLFGKVAGTIAFGKFERRAREDFVNADDFYLKFNAFTNRVHNNRCDYCSRAMTDVEIGLKWEKTFTLCQKQYPVSIAASWEHHGFFDFNQFDVDANSFTNTDHLAFDFGPYANLQSSPKKHGDLFTQGLTLSLAIGF